MRVADLMRELAASDPDAEVCCGGGMRLLGEVHVVHGVPGQIYPYVVLVPQERPAA